MDLDEEKWREERTTLQKENEQKCERGRETSVHRGQLKGKEGVGLVNNELILLLLTFAKLPLRFGQRSS